MCIKCVYLVDTKLASDKYMNIFRTKDKNTYI